MRFIRTSLNYYHHHRVKLYVIQLTKLLSNVVVCRTVVNNVGVK